MGRRGFRYHRSEDYLGSGKLSSYYDFNVTGPLTKEAQWILHYGFTDSSAIDDHAGQVSDTAFGVGKGPFTFVITKMADNEDGKQSRNPRFVASWNQSIEF